MSIKDVAEFVRSDPEIHSYGETQICHSVVMETIKALGWSSLGRKDIYSQYPIQGDFLDYCLAPSDKNKVFVEVKRPKENLSDHEQQLLRYAFGEGVKLGVLTNGIEWRFYLPLSDGSWPDRMFFKANLETDDLAELDSAFSSLLSKEAVLNGSAYTQAISMLEKIRSASAIEKMLPKAWAMILSGPDSILTALIAETVEELCGSKPTDEQVGAFLKPRLKEATLPSSPHSSPPQRPSSSVGRTTPTAEERPSKTKFAGSISDLLDEGLLSPGQEIFRVYLNKTYTAQIDGSGHIVFPDGKKFSSISAAGRYVTNASDRGWPLFHTKTVDGKTVSLHDLRLMLKPPE